jgi:hypothetical protein
MQSCKRILLATLFVFCLFLTSESHSQSSNWLWAKSGTGTDCASGYVARDPNNNIYMVGMFQTDAIVFGTATFNNHSNGSLDLFLVKYDADGNIVWALSMGGSRDEVVYGGITTDSSGNVYLAGNTSSDDLSFGSTLINNVDGNEAAFLVKYNSDGQLQSVIQSREVGFSHIAIDKDKNIYVTGTFRNTATLGTVVLTGGSADFFIAKYDANGNALWAKPGGASNAFDENRITGVCIGSDGNAYVSGIMTSPSLTLGTFTITNAGNNDWFAAKYNATDGTVVWAKQFGSTTEDRAFGIAADHQGHIYLTGYHNGDITFGSITLTNPEFAYELLVVVQCDLNGTVNWAVSAPSSQYVAGTAIATDNENGVYVTGYYSGDVTSFGTTTLPDPGSTENLFVVKYNDLGEVQWANAANSGNNDFCNSIVADNDGNAYIAGYYDTPTIGFGSDVLSQDNDADVFIAKLNGGFVTETVSTMNAQQWFAFPNPTKGKVKINGIDFNTFSFQLNIYSSTGACIYHTSFYTGEEIDLSDKPKGIYFYQLTNDQTNLKTQKIILE